MGSITINGNSYVGNSIVVSNGKVIIDSKDMTVDGKQINITINGNINDLKVDSCEKISVKGNVGSIKTTSGDVDIVGDVSGSVQTMSGDVDCSNIEGSVSTMSGDIKFRKSK